MAWWPCHLTPVHRTNSSLPSLPSPPLPCPFPQFLAVSRSYNDDLRWSHSVAANGSLTRTKVWASRLPLVHTAQGDDGSYGRRRIKSVRHLEDAVLDQQYSAENTNAPDDVFFLSNGKPARHLTAGRNHRWSVGRAQPYHPLSPCGPAARPLHTPPTRLRTALPLFLMGWCNHPTN